MPIVPSRAHDTKELIARLGDPRSARREASVARLTLLGQRAVPALMVAAESRDPLVRLGAIESLDRIGSPQGLGALTQALRDGDLRVATLAAQALGRLHGSGVAEAFEPLVGLLVDEAASEDVRLQALEALGTLSESEMRPLLTRLLRTSRTRLQRAAAALAARGTGVASGEGEAPATIPALHRELQRLGAAARRGATAAAQAKARIHVALARLDSRIALYDLREMLERRPARDVGDLLEAAAMVGDRSMLPAVVALAHDEPGLFEPCATAVSRIVERERIARAGAFLKAIPRERHSTFERLWASRTVTSRAGRRRAPSR
jgi:HEAT repeats